MAVEKKANAQIKKEKIDLNNLKTKRVLPSNNSTTEERLEELESLPRRNPILHWVAFGLSLVSFGLLCAWVFSSRGSVSINWVIFDIGLGIFTVAEFLTRSGLRWNRGVYLRTHFFDFVAIIPALALVNHGFVFEGVWVWIILVARLARAINRLLGDGFVRRNFLALVEGFEEEITDRVLQRIVTRVQADMDRAHFSHGVAEALVKNKAAVLQRVRAATPHNGFIPSLAHIVGLDAALERAEERTFDAVVGIIDSDEVDQAVRDVVNSVFSRMTSELEEKSWKHKLGIRHHEIK